MDIEEIQRRPNDGDLGAYVRKQSFKKEKSMKAKHSKDIVINIMKDWYNAMEKHNVSVQPKASTMLGTILNKHLNPTEEDVFDRYMNTKAGELESFWQSLSNSEKAYVEQRRQEMRDQYYADRGLVDQHKKELLKG
tara:strand:+ start:77 stop:484 length:408 start_codon:yes stop_codon:yes gene_type:complete